LTLTDLCEAFTYFVKACGFIVDNRSASFVPDSDFIDETGFEDDSPELTDQDELIAENDIIAEQSQPE
jgi:hypothetical protein